MESMATRPRDLLVACIEIFSAEERAPKQKRQSAIGVPGHVAQS
jgi:hypothetical protein